MKTNVRVPTRIIIATTDVARRHLPVLYKESTRTHMPLKIPLSFIKILRTWVTLSVRL